MNLVSNGGQQPQMLLPPEVGKNTPIGNIMSLLTVFHQQLTAALVQVDTALRQGTLLAPEEQQQRGKQGCPGQFQRSWRGLDLLVECIGLLLLDVGWQSRVQCHV